MELALLVYGISLLSGVITVLSLTIVVILFMIVVSFTTYDNEKWYYRDNKVAEKELWNVTTTYAMKKLGIIAFLAFVIVLIPSKQTAYTMVGAYAASKIAQSPETKVLSEKVLKVIEKQLDEYIKEPDTKK